MTIRNKYTNDLGLLVKAGIPLILTRTREPYCAMEAIECYVQGYNKRLARIKEQNPQSAGTPFCFGRWNALNGWTIKKADDFMIEAEDAPDTEELEADGCINASMALATLLGMEPNENFVDGIYVMTWLHPAFENASVLAYLLEISHRFLSENKKLILILPDSCEIPSELFDYVRYLDYDVPGEKERNDSIENVLSANEGAGLLQPGILTDKDRHLISAAGAGMTGFELENGISHAIQGLLQKLQPITGVAVAKVVQELKTDMVKRSEILEVMPSGDMSQIGGLDNLKEWIRERAKAFSPEAREFGVDIPKGIFLVGPPGSGKSASAKAVGGELGIGVVKFDVSRVFNSLVGSSEARVRRALADIKAMAPCIAFLDEIDKAFDMNSGGGDSGVGMRILGAILTFMQENDTPVFWIMTANRTQGLPPELLRKGRLDELFAVTVPNAIEREQILRIHLAKRKQDSTIDLTKAIARSAGFVAAELECAVKDCILKAFTRGSTVTDEMLYDQLDLTTPLSISFKKEFTEMTKWANDNARPASKPDPNEPKVVENAPAKKTVKVGGGRLINADVDSIPADAVV